MSAPATLVGVFTNPRSTFQSLAAKPRILTPILVVIVFQLLFAVVLAQTGILKNDTIARLEAKNSPPEQIDAVSKVMDGPAKYAFVIAGPVVLVFSLLVSGALIYFMGNLMLGARLRYAHYLSIAAYGAVVGIVDQLVRLGIALGRGTLMVHLGIGAFLGEEGETERWTYARLAEISQRAAGAWRNLGVAPGDRVGLLGSDSGWWRCSPGS